MKTKNLLLIVITIAIAIVINGCAKEDPKGVAARVNEEDIKQETFDTEYSIYEELYKNQLGEDVLDQVMPDGTLFKDQLKVEVLGKLVMEELISQDSKKENIEVTDEEIDKQMAATIENMGGQEELDKFLEDLGMDEEYFKENTKRDLMLQKHKENFIENFDLEDKETEEFFEENKDDLVIVKARHILVDTEEEGKEVLDKLKNGEAFEKVAMESSKDQNSSALGGEMGFFSKGQISEEFDNVVFNLKEGEISPLIATEVGFDIVEVQERKDTFEALKPEIEGLLKQNKYDEHVQKLEEEAKIEDYITVEEDKENEEEVKEEDKEEDKEETEEDKEEDK